MGISQTCWRKAEVRAWDREASTERMHPLRTLSPLSRQKGAVPWEEVEREGVWVTKWLRGRELREELGWGVLNNSQDPKRFRAWAADLDP